MKKKTILFNARICTLQNSNKTSSACLFFLNPAFFSNWAHEKLLSFKHLEKQVSRIRSSFIWFPFSLLFFLSDVNVCLSEREKLDKGCCVEGIHVLFAIVSIISLALPVHKVSLGNEFAKIVLHYKKKEDENLEN